MCYYLQPISWWSKSATPSAHFADMRFAVNLSSCWHEILRSTYLTWKPQFIFVEKGLNPPPPLTTMLARDSTIKLSSSGIKSATLSDHYVQCDVVSHLSSSRFKSATPSDHYVDRRYYFQPYLHKESIPPPLWSLCCLGYYCQLIFTRNQIRHPCRQEIFPSFSFNLSSWLAPAEQASVSKNEASLPLCEALLAWK